MGTWGTALYSDDTTCDVRDSYISNLKYGFSDTEAYERILLNYAELLDDKEIACLVYFALADTAWKYGRLTESLKSQALKLIEEGGDVFVWERDSPIDAKTRQKILGALASRLLSNQPAPKLIKISKPKPKKIRTSEPLGTLFFMALPSGNKALFALVGFIELEKSIEPVFSVLNWRGQQLPSQATLHTACQKTLIFKSGLGDQAHIGILPKDRRTNTMTFLEASGHCTEIEMAFDAEKVVFINKEAIAKEIDQHFDN